MTKKKIYKPAPVSGFPEWLPEVRRAEQMWFDQIRSTFERYGFCSIETPSIETLDAINAKGGDGGADVDKEVYVLERLHKEETDKEARLAMRFDQTVPLARYTAQHFNDLTFPFKRYQIQKVWRGERPQSGRFREFYQCDIDVINPDQLPLHFDAEMPAIIWEILSSLPGMEEEKIQIRISNRKIVMGLTQALFREKETGIEIIRAIDKLEKEGYDYVERRIAIFLDKSGQPYEGRHIKTIMDLAEIKASPENCSGLLRDFIARNDVIARNDSDDAIQLFNEGIEELTFVMNQLAHLPEGAVVADLSIVRGLDYYTGTVYETVFLDDPGYGSICSGGRYDDLASNYINKNLPGVGISIGFSRLFERIRSQNKLPKLGSSPAQVLIALPEEEHRPLMTETAHNLRTRGINVETFHSASKIKRQLAYAEKKGIPYVWFPDLNEVKDMDKGEQTKADPKTWRPK